MKISARNIIALPIRLYRFAVSPLFGSSCRFHPSCSAYALEALERHGALKGLWLSCKRIGKCHPYCTAEWHDPVPKEFTRHNVFGYKRTHNINKTHYIKHQSGKASIK